MLFVAVAALCGMCLPPPSQHPPDALTVFDSRSESHLESNVQLLFVRQSTDGKEYGADALDPLL